MSDIKKLPDVKEIVGAMIFGSTRSISVNDILRCIKDVAGTSEDYAKEYGKVTKGEIEKAVKELIKEINRSPNGFSIVDTTDGYKFQTAANCGRWLRHYLEIDKPSRLSMPALETLSVIAYRQPVSKTNIEAVRGVNSSNIVKNLMEMHLVKITGRSELPGRPFLYGTTKEFLNHFGLKDLNDLDSIKPAFMAMAQKGEDEEEQNISSTVQEELDRQEKEDGAPRQTNFNL
ncbi:MAG: SMC-Scp complex subunit ScpB [Kiritimatiellae bacterium]|jgi:segregation and condensation protein B|nr:SMC-Scp complex subunit ScpB [Kiritimatiellia bacterium]